MYNDVLDVTASTIESTTKSILQRKNSESRKRFWQPLMPRCGRVSRCRATHRSHYCAKVRVSPFIAEVDFFVIGCSGVLEWEADTFVQEDSGEQGVGEVHNWTARKELFAERARGDFGWPSPISYIHTRVYIYLTVVIFFRRRNMLKFKIECLNSRKTRPNNCRRLEKSRECMESAVCQSRSRRSKTDIKHFL